MLLTHTGHVDYEELCRLDVLGLRDSTKHERGMHSVYKHADGKKINDRRIVLDVERGRTVKSWKPQRLGGGLGGARNGAAEVNVRHKKGPWSW